MLWVSVVSSLVSLKTDYSPFSEDVAPLWARKNSVESLSDHETFHTGIIYLSTRSP